MNAVCFVLFFLSLFILWCEKSSQGKLDLSKLKKGDPNFLEKHLEILSFAYPYPAPGGGENRLQFFEENPKSSELLEETEAKLRRPVLLNEEELKKVASN